MVKDQEKGFQSGNYAVNLSNASHFAFLEVCGGWSEISPSSPSAEFASALDLLAGLSLHFEVEWFDAFLRNFSFFKQYVQPDFCPYDPAFLLESRQRICWMGLICTLKSRAMSLRARVDDERIS